MLQLKFIVTICLRKAFNIVISNHGIRITYDLKDQTYFININRILHSKIQVLDPEATINNSTKQ